MEKYKPIKILALKRHFLLMESYIYQTYGENYVFLSNNLFDALLYEYNSKVSYGIKPFIPQSY